MPTMKELIVQARKLEIKYVKKRKVELEEEIKVVLNQNLIKALQKQKQQKQTPVVIGPVRGIVLYSKKYDKRILLFGEYHRRKQICANTGDRRLNIVDFLEEGFKYVGERSFNKVVDVFIEYPLLLKSSTNINLKKIPFTFYDLTYIRKSWADCLRQNKSKCKFENVRLHYTDARQIFINDNDDPIINAIDLLGQLETQNTKEKKKEERVQHALLLLTPNATVKYIRNIIKFDRQLSRIRWSFVRNALEKFWLDQFSRPFLILKRYLKENISHINSNNNEFFDTLKIGSKYYVAAGLMDCYTIARMMRCFSKSEVGSTATTNKLYCQDPSQIIFYGGDSHTLKLYTFFTGARYLGRHFRVSNHWTDTLGNKTTPNIPITIKGEKCLYMPGFDWDQVFPPQLDKHKQPRCPN